MGTMKSFQTAASSKPSKCGSICTYKKQKSVSWIKCIEITKIHFFHFKKHINKVWKLAGFGSWRLHCQIQQSYFIRKFHSLELQGQHSHAEQTDKQSIGKTLRIWVNKFSVQNRRQAFLSSLRKQPTFGDATTGFPTKWRLRNERRNSILMTRHYPDLGSASDWSCRVGNLIQPIRSTTQIWVVMRHQYGISALVFQTSFGGETSGSVAKCRLLSQAIFYLTRQ